MCICMYRCMLGETVVLGDWLRLWFWVKLKDKFSPLSMLWFDDLWF